MGTTVGDQGIKRREDETSDLDFKKPERRFKFSLNERQLYAPYLGGM
jgi:hypothetical protein